MPKKTIEEMTRTELVRELEMSRETTRRMTPLPADSEQLIHDLQVHKIELEMQNRELRAAQALLEESRSRYADLYDFAPIGYLTLDGSGVIREINLTGAAMLGVPRERLVGRPFVSVVSMPSAEPFRRHLARCAEREPRVVSELTFSVRGRGPVIVQAVSVAAEPEAQRGAPAFRTALVDISALKAWEGKLGFLADVGEVLAGSLDVRTTLAAVVQLAVPALADVCAADVVDDEGRLERLDVACSPPADQDVLVGRLDRFAALVDGARFHDSILQSGRPLLFLAPLAAAKTPIAPDEPLERQAFRASGFSSVMVVPLATRGRSIGILTLVAAGSGRRYTEADLALASDLGRRAAAAIDNAHLHATARRAVGARDHVLALVAHDLRNPLHSIGMRLDLLEQRSPPSERQPETHKTIGAVRRAVAMMERLTSDLLDFGSIERGQLAVTKRAEAVGTMLSDAVEQHQPSATKKSLDLSVAPPPSDDFEVGCDRARILQALSNLISNAIKFTDRGSILVSAERNDNEVCFTVADSGPGIPEAERSRIFERYWQATPRARSVGLGLAIARGIVEAHAGRIWVEGRAGGGSTFRFAIPVS